MPELPEIEHLRRSLEPALLQATVSTVTIHRRDVIHSFPASAKQVRPRDLLARHTITALDRRGKQLAVLTDGPALCIHLGMSGQLRFVPQGTRLQRSDHVHCRWRIDGPHGPGTLIFRDPRRFGGIWTFPTSASIIQDRWSCLGPDALTIRASVLADRLSGRHRPIKAALLDQQLIAGIGNIYADEALFTARIHPMAVCASISRAQFRALAGAIRTTLRSAVAAGGSTLRDYADANGQAGWFSVRHRVYGRGGQPCEHCGRTLLQLTVAQRTTVACPACQPWSD